ncbi:MAG: hypothetical protein K2V38_27820 [Gemmataceae bacterium]|nr:hypothetical protein [Gemmataceae bacterium]
MPHNRVTRERIRDPSGRVTGYGPPAPVPEPPLPACGCRRVTRPSGRTEVELAGPRGADLRRLQEAYRLARRPKPSAPDLGPLPVAMDDVRRWARDIGG